jgi:hypothetical protein
MKNAHDKSHRDVQFEASDWVLLRLNHRSAAGITDRANAKLAPKYYGPFQVRGRIGPLAYRLQLPPRSRIHDVFHVVFLKKFEGTPPSAVPSLPPLTHGRVIPLPARVIRARRTATSWEVLVKWLGHDDLDASWEPLEDFKERYPDFKLEDELFSQAGGSVMDSVFGKQYRRLRGKHQAPASG